MGAVAMSTIICRRCREPFEANPFGRKRRQCQKCRPGTGQMEERACSWCRTAFTCPVGGTKTYCSGDCRSEASRQRRYGPRFRRDTWARMSRKIIPTSGCWQWVGGRSGLGGKHGVIDDGPAARRVYELLVGPVPEGAEVRHLCSNQLCVNPQHLEAAPSRRVGSQ